MSLNPNSNAQSSVLNTIHQVEGFDPSIYAVPAKPGNVCLLWPRWPGFVWFTRKVRSQ